MTKTIYRTYRRKLILNRSQENRLLNWLGTCRLIYNLSRETKDYAFYSRRISMSAYDLQKQITELRREYDWIADVPYQSLEDVTQRLHKAYSSFFRGGGYPKWAKRDKYNSITFKKCIEVSPNQFKIPKLGIVRTFKDRSIKGRILRCTIKTENGDYFISIMVSHDCKNLIKSIDQSVGVDVGISKLAALSNGGFVSNLRLLREYEPKLRIEQRALARCKRGSHNRQKQKKKLAKVYLKLRNVRQDFLHKESKKLVDNYGFIAVEDLNVKGMVKNHNLAKRISDASWSEFFRMLEYKSDWYGNTFIKVDPKYTSQTCNSCGAIDKASRRTQAIFKCTSCGHQDNADVNAAKNILGQGMADYRKREALA